MLRATYGWVDETAILWREWEWLEATVSAIGADRRETRRWDLTARLASMAAAQNGGKSLDWWRDLVNQTLTRAEREAQFEAEEAEARQAAAAVAETALADAAEHYEATGGYEQTVIF